MKQAKCKKISWVQFSTLRSDQPRVAIIISCQVLNRPKIFLPKLSIHPYEFFLGKVQDITTISTL